MVSEATQALERLLVRRRRLSERILSLDGYARWGAHDPDDEGRTYQAIETADRQVAELDRELDRLVRATRARQPAAVEAWADANIQLVEAYLATLDEVGEDTHRHVAQEELRAWHEVRAGMQSFVRQNVYYVRADAALYRSLFGFDRA